MIAKVRAPRPSRAAEESASGRGVRLALRLAWRRGALDPLPVLMALVVLQVAALVAGIGSLRDSEVLQVAFGAPVLMAALWPLARRRAGHWLALAAGASIAHLAAHPLTDGSGLDLLLDGIATAGLVAALAHAVHHSPGLALAKAFPSAPDSLLARIARGADTTSFEQGEVVVAERDPADRFYVITAGEAEVTGLDDDVEVYLGTLVRGDVFGEVGLLTAGARTATVRAVSRLDVVSLDDDSFAAVVEESDGTAEELERLLRARSTQPRAREDAVPLPPWTRLVQRVFKHPRARHYNRLIAIVLAGNLALLVYGLAGGEWWTRDGIALETLAILAQANLALAVFFRLPSVINLLGRLATRPPATWPLRIRWTLAKYYHFGGLHVGAAVAATIWFAALVSGLVVESARGRAALSAPGLALSVAAAVLLVVMVVMASPRLRSVAHDHFEVTHRFFGWAALVLVWITTILFVTGGRGDEPVAAALLTAPTVWLLLGTTACVLWPWLRLRKVAVTVERPSPHVALATLHYEVTPGVGTTRAISRRALIGWHHFANIPMPDGSPGHRMAISRAGDWTAGFIDDPPAHVWVRGVPTVELANVERLFTKVVYVVTGTGIGPALGHLLDEAVPSRLVWITRNPRATYGDALYEEIVRAQPDAIIWNTDERGKPDVLRLAYGALRASGAEAVICISNPAVTWRVVHGLERRGIPAFGPIWDS